MSHLQELLHEIRRRSLWQILLVYGGVSYALLEAVGLFIERLHLPEGLFIAALVLLMIGLPVVVTTASVQRKRPEPSSEEAEDEEGDGGLRGLFTWRNSFLGGLVAFSLWGVVATGLLLVAGDGSLPDARKSIAVLPFVNMSADPENEYFSDGITDDIITRLSKISDLKVISRTSVMQYKGTEQTMREIGAQLGVATILEGGVQRVGDRVRISAQLIDVETDEHLWAEQFNRELTDVFQIQGEVAGQIAAALEAELSPEEEERMARRPTESLEAYNSYLLGRYHWNKRSEEGFWQAIDYFKQAIAEDSTFALAYTGLADTYTLLVGYNAAPATEIMPQARAAALKAIEIDSTLGEAYTSLAQVRRNFDWDWVGTQAAHSRALELNPGYATAHHWYAFYLITMSMQDSALAEMRRARELDPLSLIITAEVGWPLYRSGRYDEAIEEYLKAIAMDPNFAPAHSWLGLAYVQKGRFEEALASCQEAVRLSERYPRWLANLAYVYASWGKRAEALALLDELNEMESERYIEPALYSWVYGELGETDRAFEYLERAYRERSPWMTDLTGDPKFDSLRPDPRFGALLERVGLN